MAPWPSPTENHRVGILVVYIIQANPSEKRTGWRRSMMGRRKILDIARHLIQQSEKKKKSFNI